MDPAQSNIVVRSRNGWVLVIPVNLITQIMHSAYSDPHIQWRDWGEDVIRVNFHPTAVTVQLVDAKMLVLCKSPPYCSVEVYDLSKLGQKDIQVLPFGREQGDSCRRVLSTPKWSRKLQMGDGVPSRLHLVGNKVVGFYVSPLCVRNWSNLNLVLHRRVQARITIIYASGRWVRCEKPVGCVTNGFIYTARPWWAIQFITLKPSGSVYTYNHRVNKWLPRGNDRTTSSIRCGRAIDFTLVRVNTLNSVKSLPVFRSTRLRGTLGL